MLPRKDRVLLVKFSVTNFKNFRERVELDLNSRHAFVDDGFAVDNGVVTKAMLSGKSGSGKTNLSLALFDIATHLTDNAFAADRYDPYLNLDSGKGYAEFEYTFKYERTKLVYRYVKRCSGALLYESVTINGKEVLRYDFLSRDGVAELDGRTFVLSGFGASVSRVRAVADEVASINASEIKAFISIVEFAKGMMLFDTLCDDGYQGLRMPDADCIKGIVRNHGVERFGDLLKEYGADYNLVVKESDGEDDLFCRFKNGDVPFRKIASKEEMSLAVYYYRRMFNDQVSLLYIDDFDSLYRRETAEMIADLMKYEVNVQAILSTHEDFSRNNIRRPDSCFYVLENGHIRPVRADV